MFSLEEIKEDPKKYAENETVSTIIKFLKKANKYYYNSNNLLVSDSTYDIIYDIVYKRDSANDFFSRIGFKNKENKVKLPLYMGSQNKVKTYKELSLWLNKNSVDKYILTPKLDGMSALLQIKNGVVKLFTRGNGIYGRDISHLIKYIDISKCKGHQNMSIRGELIISKENYKKYETEYTTCRSMIVGLTNNKIIDETKIGYMDFVAFDIYNDTMNLLEKIELLKTTGIKSVLYTIVNYENILEWESEKKNFLLEKLCYYRQSYNYSIDGLIVTCLNANIMNTDSNPKYSIAFKANNYGKITTIQDIIWNISKHGRLVPKIKFNKIDLGSQVEFCSGKSAQFIFNNCLNIGSKIRVVLSGEIIPNIEEIIYASYYPLMPSIGYKWDKNHVNINILDKNNEQELQQIKFFFKAIGVDNIGIGILKKIIEGGYNNLKLILELKTSNLEVLDGFDKILSKKIVENIKTVIETDIYLPKLMHGSCVFKGGFGVKKFEKIIENYPNFLEDNITYEMLLNIQGFSELSATKFLEQISEFKRFLKVHKMLHYYVNVNDNVEINNDITGKIFVFTGKKDKLIISIIDNYNGIINNTVTKETDYLVYEDIKSTSVKIIQAKKFNIRLLSSLEFKTLFKKLIN